MFCALEGRPRRQRCCYYCLLR
eukprot:SAG25_NODE_13895_length_261_cov_0.956790_1_plen_21_part_01